MSHVSQCYPWFRKLHSIWPKTSFQYKVRLPKPRIAKTMAQVWSPGADCAIGKQGRISCNGRYPCWETDRGWPKVKSIFSPCNLSSLTNKTAKTARPTVDLVEPEWDWHGILPFSDHSTDTLGGTWICVTSETFNLISGLTFEPSLQS